jgi:hypothetical protein
MSFSIFLSGLSSLIALLQIGTTIPTDIAEPAPLVKQPVIAQQPTEKRQAPLYQPLQPVAQPFRLYDDAYYAAQLDDTIPYLYVSNEATTSPQHCKSLVYQTFDVLPSQHTASLRYLDLNFSQYIRRGLTSSNTMQLRCANITDAVLVSVLIHEIGHLVDLGQFKGDYTYQPSEFRDFGYTIYENDLSIAFYRISWTNEYTMHPGSTSLDFVSGYAMTDPFEDFAEAYNWYILHGANFRKLAESNDVLQHKYTFLKTYVFSNKEFGTKVTLYDNFKRVFDSTLIPYSLRTFLNNTV